MANHEARPADYGYYFPPAEDAEKQFRRTGVRPTTFAGGGINEEFGVTRSAKHPGEYALGIDLEFGTAPRIPSGPDNPQTPPYLKL